MTIRISIDMFSGRPNPTIEIEESDLPGGVKLAAVRKAMLASAISLTTESTSALTRPLLGYRGVFLEDFLQLGSEHSLPLAHPHRDLEREGGCRAAATERR